MKDCPNCGREIRRNAKFCRFCGTVVPGEGQLDEEGASLPRQTRVLGSPPLPAVAPPASLPPTVSASNPRSASLAGKRRASGEWKSGEASLVPFPASSPPERRSTANLRSSDPEMMSVRPEDFSLAPPTNILIGPFQQAGFHLRFGAAMVDFTLYVVWFFICMVGSSFVLKSLPGMSLVLQWTGWVGFLALLGLNLFVLPIRRGQSVGKWVVGIRIIRTDFSRPRLSTVLKRHFVGYPISAVSMLGFLWVLWDRRQQGWHDKLAHTLVVRTDD